jgi:hypothetical protein
MLDFANRVLTGSVAETEAAEEGAYRTVSGAVYLLVVHDGIVVVHRDTPDEQWSESFDSVCIAVGSDGRRYLLGANFDALYGYGTARWFHSTALVS